MSKNNYSASGEVGAVGLLGVLFVGLKLTGFIAWSWFWVTAPFWGPLLLCLVLLFFVLIFGLPDD